MNAFIVYAHHEPTSFTAALRNAAIDALVADGHRVDLSDYDGTGKYDTMERVLYPLHRGVLEFTGFEVLPPFVVYGPQRTSSNERAQALRRMRLAARAVAAEDVGADLYA